LIVADASAVGEVLLARPSAPAIRGVLVAHEEVHVPEHFHVEVISMLRRFALRGELGERRAALALSALQELRVVRYHAVHLLDAIWELRDQLTAYDAAYLALARRLGLPLLTVDGGLAAAARVEGLLAEVCEQGIAPAP
jgi:predicted nucleic acid-binding protein